MNRGPIVVIQPHKSHPGQYVYNQFLEKLTEEVRQLEADYAELEEMFSELSESYDGCMNENDTYRDYIAELEKKYTDRDSDCRRISNMCVDERALHYMYKGQHRLASDDNKQFSEYIAELEKQRDELIEYLEGNNKTLALYVPYRWDNAKNQIEENKKLIIRIKEGE